MASHTMSLSNDSDVDDLDISDSQQAIITALMQPPPPVDSTSSLGSLNAQIASVHLADVPIEVDDVTIEPVTAPSTSSASFPTYEELFHTKAHSVLKCDNRTISNDVALVEGVGLESRTIECDDASATSRIWMVAIGESTLNIDQIILHLKKRSL